MEGLEFCNYRVLGKSHYRSLRLTNMCPVDFLNMFMQTCEVQQELKLMVEGLIFSSSLTITRGRCGFIS